MVSLLQIFVVQWILCVWHPRINKPRGCLPQENNKIAGVSKLDSQKLTLNLVLLGIYYTHEIWPGNQKMVGFKTNLL